MDTDSIRCRELVTTNALMGYITSNPNPYPGQVGAVLEIVQETTSMPALQISRIAGTTSQCIRITTPSGSPQQSQLQCSGTSAISFYTGTGSGIANGDVSFPVDGSTTNQGIVYDNSEGTILFQHASGARVAASGALVEMWSIQRGFLPPRATSAQIQAMQPIVGMIVFNTTSGGLMCYGAASGAAAWAFLGANKGSP